MGGSADVVPFLSSYSQGVKVGRFTAGLSIILLTNPCRNDVTNVIKVVRTITYFKHNEH